MDEPRILLMPLGTGEDAVERMRGALAVAITLGAHLRVLHSNLDPRALLPEEDVATLNDEFGSLVRNGIPDPQDPLGRGFRGRHGSDPSKYISRVTAFSRSILRHAQN